MPRQRHIGFILATLVAIPAAPLWGGPPSLPRGAYGLACACVAAGLLLDRERPTA